MNPERVDTRPPRSSGVAVAVDRFLHEIRIAATLQHPHILGLIDSGVLGDERVSRARIRDAVSDAVLPEMARD
jgi:hypothetical protein